MLRKFFIIFLFLPSTFVLADLDVSEYKFQKKIIPQGGGVGNFSIIIDKDIYEKSNEFFSDLKVIDKNNKEIFYKIYQKKDIVSKKVKEENIIFKKKTNNIFILDLGIDREYINNIKIITSSVDFHRSVDIYGSNLKDSGFEKISGDGGDLIFSSPGKSNLQLNFNFTNYRFLKVIFLGENGNFNVDDFLIKRTDRKVIKGEKDIFSIYVEKKYTNKQKSYFLFKIPSSNIPINSLVLKTKENNLSRKIEIFSSNNKDSEFLLNEEKYDKDKSYWKKIYSGIFEKESLDNQVFEINDNKKYYLVVVDNKGGAKINIISAEMTRFFDIIFLKDLDFENNNYKIIYDGNKTALKPTYDSVYFDDNFKNFTRLLSGEEEENKLFKEKKQRLYNNFSIIINLLKVLIIIILSWFVYKILKETKREEEEVWDDDEKEEEEEIDIVSKL